MARKPRPEGKREAARRRRKGPPAALPTIVAVGASAGGLEAFTELLSAFPRESAQEMAFVFLQHLQPAHTSLLPELLQKSTFLRVEDVRDGTLPEAGRVYVLPAGKEMVLQKGRLRLSARPRELSLPIDKFMRSLAEERKSAAIGVVLAGTASDGTLGLEAIKAEGGICFAQSEDTTEFNGMARSAIGSGCVDFVLAPAEIARELARVGRHPYVAPGADEHKAATLRLNAASHRTYSGILEIVRRDTGMDFTEYRSSTIGRRIARRMALHTQERPEDYLRYLRDHPHEVSQLGEDILIPATRFFRDPEVFEALKTRILMPLVRQRQPSSQPIRLWSVGCSTGEEAFSLAMIALECLGGQGGGGAMVQVFGTDLNEAVVRRARAGRYGADISADVSAERLRRFFVKADGGYQVSRALREACIFARHNVVREAPFSRLDVICCRNVMIYMEPALQRRLLPVLHYALNSGGTLALGTAERASLTPRLFRPAPRLSRKLKIYVKQGVSEPVHIPLTDQHAAGESVGKAAAGSQSTGALGDSRKEADDILLNQFAPPGVIVDVNLDVIDFRGRTSDFLEPAPGPASLNLFKMARGDLGAYVRSAVLQARRQQAPVRIEGVHAGPGRESALQVVPLGAGGPHPPAQFLVLFLNPGPDPADKSKGKAAPAKVSRSARRELDHLRRSLSASQQLISTLSDEFQAAKQEYQAANEEIASANEELQSTNEELETSKEELQSSNEELNTVNEELRHSNAEQHQVANDLENLIEAIDIAFVLLDVDLRVRRYSPAAERLLRLIPADVGRRIGEIRWPIHIADLGHMAMSVLNKAQPQARTVRDAEGHYFELRLNPRRGQDRKLEGVVVVLADTDASQRVSNRLDGSEKLVADLLETIGAAALVGRKGEVLHTTAAFRALVGDGDHHSRWPKAVAAQTKDKQHTRVELRRDGRMLHFRARRLGGADGPPLVLLTFEHD